MDFKNFLGWGRILVYRGNGSGFIALGDRQLEGQLMKTVYYNSGFQQPKLCWRPEGQNHFHVTEMIAHGPGRTENETCWTTSLPVPDNQVVQAYIVDGEQRDPARRHYEIHTREAYLQDGQLFRYRPAPKVEAARRDYDPGRPPCLDSKILGERRPFRVYLPRGYRQHLSRRYPVLYLLDGQNIFEKGPFGSWNAQPNIDRLITRGQIEEVIVVAVDHGGDRFADYVPKEDGGAADRYARFMTQELKPWVDRSYRTLSGPADTAVMGSSLGGVAALYLGWDYFHVFGKVACLSGSWWLKGFQNRLLGQQKRPIRCYIDSGDSGPYNDCIHHTLALKDGLENRMGYREGEMLHVVGREHSHTEAAWGQRMIHALRFLFPLTQGQDERTTLGSFSKRAA
jgi:enterochelin esterase-like enzyme